MNSNNNNPSSDQEKEFRKLYFDAYDRIIQQELNEKANPRKCSLGDVVCGLALLIRYELFTRWWDPQEYRAYRFSRDMYDHIRRDREKRLKEANNKENNE